MQCNELHCARPALRCDKADELGGAGAATTHPPSLATRAHAGPKVVGKLADGGDVCILTLTASNGQSAMSAKTSAEAEAASQTKVRYSTAVSWPTSVA